jgi:hypothetical protein
MGVGIAAPGQAQNTIEKETQTTSLRRICWDQSAVWRAELVAAVKSARREFKEGRCRPATPAQIIKRLHA